LILKKIIKTVATKYRVFNTKKHKIQFRLGFCARPHWGRLGCSPKHIPGWVSNPTCKRRKGKEAEGKKGWNRWDKKRGKNKRQRREGRKREGREGT